MSLPCDFEISMLYVDDVSTYPSACIGEDIPDSDFSPSNPRVLMLSVFASKKNKIKYPYYLPRRRKALSFPILHWVYRKVLSLLILFLIYYCPYAPQQNIINYLFQIQDLCFATQRHLRVRELTRSIFP